MGSEFHDSTFFLGGCLFTRGDSAQPIGQFFVNFSPVADGEDPDDPRFAIQLVKDAESPDFE